ncbi:unnamed protein product [Symbiodinium necroappetens]|uniref:Histidine kinase n=1 Tax=Symbiodinium necroappetens TaxID=1628268 RepID=A0A812VSM9_9DINO|nr:unnamed protein product [Symbiodinium necroappetens]
MHEDCVLLCRSKKGGYCYLPGGHVDPGEPSADACKREILEEIGLDVTVGACLLVNELIFSQDHIEFVWAPLAAVVEMDLRPDCVRAWIASGGKDRERHTMPPTHDPSTDRSMIDAQGNAPVNDRTQRLTTLGVLAGSIAHEVNNLLTPVLSYAQLALQHPDDQELAEKALSKAVAGTEKVGHIMSSLLGFVRGEAEEREAPVEFCLREALNCMARSLDKDNIALDHEIEPELSARISPIALQQVLLNLILNARDAILPQRGSLAVHAKRSTWNTPDGRPKAAVVIEVRDSGCGMDETMLENAFLPFVSNRHNAADGVGTGLGLPICKQLVEEVGGRIVATSEPGEGTTFTITLEESHTESPMKREIFTAVAALSLLGAGASFLHVHSGVFFKIRHMGVSNFMGRFNEVDGSFNLDWDNPSASFMDMTVVAGSVDSNNAKRDDHLKSPDFFNAKQFPTMTFEGTSFTAVDAETMNITGNLTYLGQTKPVTITANLVEVGDTRQGYKMGVDATFSFKRTDFGDAKYIAEGGLGDEVEIMAFLAGVRGE